MNDFDKFVKWASITVFVLILLGLASMAGAQEALPVAPVATQPAQTLGDMVSQAVFAVVSAFLLFVVNYCKVYIATRNKQANHERGVAVVKDALYSSLDDTGYTLKQVLTDADIKAAVKVCWLRISLSRLDNLAGFKKADPEAWVKEQQGIILGKLAS